MKVILRSPFVHDPDVAEPVAEGVAWEEHPHYRGSGDSGGCMPRFSTGHGAGGLDDDMRHCGHTASGSPRGYHPLADRAKSEPGARDQVDTPRTEPRYERAASDILRLVGLLWLLKVTRFVEIIRLLLGGTPERR